MSAWRMKLFPENKYLSVSQKPAWDLLRKLENEDLKDWSNRLIDFIECEMKFSKVQPLINYFPLFDLLDNFLFQ